MLLAVKVLRVSARALRVYARALCVFTRALCVSARALRVFTRELRMSARALRVSARAQLTGTWSAVQHSLNMWLRFCKYVEYGRVVLLLSLFCAVSLKSLSLTVSSVLR